MHNTPFTFAAPSFSDTDLSYTEYCQRVSVALFEQASQHYSVTNSDGTVYNPVLFATVHGSYLYGTAHAGSDLDCYLVVDNVKNKQSVSNTGIDTARFSTHKFLELVTAGSHQAVEALYSPYAVFNSRHPYYEMVQCLQPSVFNFMRKSMSAATSFRYRVAEELGVDHPSFIPDNAVLDYTQHKRLHHAERLEAGVNTVLRGGFAAYTPVWVPR